jgi:hypothetical protein
MEQVPRDIAAVVDLLRQAVDREGLRDAARRRVLAAVRHAIITRIISKNTRYGKKCQRRRQIDRAYPDYKVGVRGLALFRKHIPNFAKLSRWRRKEEQSRLVKALQKRTEREKKRPPAPTIPTKEEELSPRQFGAESGNCRPDNMT